MKGCVLGGDAHDGVGAALPERPEDLPDVQPLRVRHLAPYTVRGLRHGVTETIPVQRSKQCCPSFPRYGTPNGNSE